MSVETTKFIENQEIKDGVPWSLKEIKSLKIKEIKEMNKAVSWFHKELSSLKTEIKTELMREQTEHGPKIIELKNGFKVKNYWTFFSIDVNDERYWITIKIVDDSWKKVNSGWRIVFEAKHEWFYSANDVVLELSNDEMTNDTNIDMINWYLKIHDLPLIVDENDINTLKWLFSKINQLNG